MNSYYPENLVLIYIDHGVSERKVDTMFTPDLKITSSIWEDLHRYISGIDLTKVENNSLNRKYSLCFVLGEQVAVIVDQNTRRLNEWIRKLRCVNMEFPKLSCDTRFHFNVRPDDLKYCVINAEIIASVGGSLIHVSNCKSIVEKCESLIV